ncbi:glucosamine-6-phosphate deaminase [Priestia abyssalis]|uniref:glucosamine-6-phosphate deaminase n=1 Tax=Priestia abyssalis TaxID=1221450 RepID=UPI00099521D5|nr:glucosamine-6-phosphate deaminase [Priestia abyssalis]
MNIIEVKNYEEMSQKAAGFIRETVRKKPNAVLGMATGGTAVGTYKYLIQDFNEHGTSYNQAYTVNLDEYVGMDPTHEQSYHTYMDSHLFQHIDMPKEHQYLPNGKAAHLEAECKRYEEAIEALGGVDLQILGIGHNGHIGFNEPGTSFDSKTQVVKLAESTRNANARYFDQMDEVPTHAITMGIATILKSKNILLLVSGKGKAEILHKLLTSDVTEEIPATALKTHPNVTIIADKEALSCWNNRETEMKLGV